MLLILDDEHKEHLNFLTDIDVQVLQEFGKIALEFLKTPPNVKLYQTAAQKLQVESATVQHGVEGLMHLLTESVRLELSDLDFQDSILTLGFSDEHKKELLRIYLENKQKVKEVLLQMSMDLPHYHNLEWRLDVEFGSRTLQHQVIPSILMKLHTQDNGETSTHVLQTDPSNLVHLTQSLEQALSEAKSQHSRRIMRNINK